MLVAFSPIFVADTKVIFVYHVVAPLTPTVSFDIFMDNYFASFCLLIHLGVNKIWAKGVLNKIKLHKCTEDKQLQKRDVATLSSTGYIKQKSSVTWVVG